MMDLISTIMTESDAYFHTRLMEANADTREELLSMRDGLKSREAFLQGVQSKVICFETVSEKLEKIKEWYPRAYDILNQMSPGLMLWPDDMAPAVLRLADSLVKGCLLPDDQWLLGLSVSA